MPIRTIYAGENPKFFGRQGGLTYYNLTSDQFTGLNGIVVTGTLRDSLVLLSLLLGQQTPLHPHEVMTDTGAYADVMFGLLWLLGYQFSPRISDIGGTASGASTARRIMAHSTVWLPTRSTRA